MADIEQLYSKIDLYTESVDELANTKFNSEQWVKVSINRCSI